MLHCGAAGSETSANTAVGAANHNREFEMQAEKIVQLAALDIVGPEIKDHPSSGAFAQCWQDLFSGVEALEAELKPSLAQPAYGIQTYDADMQSKNIWFYMAGLGDVDQALRESLPAGFQRRQLPANTYAVFEYRGAIGPALGELFQAIYQSWLPNSEYQLAGNYDFELYDQRFKGPENPESSLSIYIPVKAK